MRESRGGGGCSGNSREGGGGGGFGMGRVVSMLWGGGQRLEQLGRPWGGGKGAGGTKEGSGSGERRERIWKGAKELEEERGIILNHSVHKKLVRSADSPVQPSVPTIREQFKDKPAQRTEPDQNGDQLTVRSASPVWFLKH